MPYFGTFHDSYIVMRKNNDVFNKIIKSKNQQFYIYMYIYTTLIYYILK